MVGEDAPGMVAYTRVGVGLFTISCVFGLNYSDAEEAYYQKVASAHNTYHTTRQMVLILDALKFGEIWKYSARTPNLT